MDTPSSLSTELLDVLSTLIKAGKFKEALELPNDNKYADVLKDNCWDLIPFLLSRIEDDTIITWPALQTCCERLLRIVAERANPDEVLLELLERIEICKNDAQFMALLEPLQIVLKRIASRRGRSLEWCLTSIHTYIEKLPLPENYNFTDLENLLRDSDPSTRRILKIYAQLPTFYGYFIKEALSEKKRVNSMRDILLCFLIDLLAKPLAVLDLINRKTPSQCRIIAEDIFKDIYTLQPDPFFFLQYISIKYRGRRKEAIEGGVYESGPGDIFLLDEKLPKLGMAVYYYLLLAENLPTPLLPQVYNYTFVAHQLLNLASYLLQLDDNLLHEKGLKLSSALIQLLPEKCSGNHLSHRGHADLFQSLCSVAVFCTVESFRKMAVKIIRDYLFKFDSKGRYHIIVNLLPSLQHSGIKGHIIILYKEVLVEAWGQGDLSFYSGKKLAAILNVSCLLSEGAETDLVETADLIISCLNLLRYLFLKDVSNATGIWDNLPQLEREYLTVLRSGIDLSRAHYEARLLDVDADDSKKESESEKIDVTVNGSTPETLSPQNKRMVINSGINALHVIDSLLCRLNECIFANKRNQFDSK